MFFKSLFANVLRTVTTLKPELGKLMYKDHKQVRVHMGHYCMRCKSFHIYCCYFFDLFTFLDFCR